MKWSVVVGDTAAGEECVFIRKASRESERARKSRIDV